MTNAQQQSAPSVNMSKRVTFGLATVFLTYFVYSYFFQSLLSALPKIAANLDGMHLYSWGVSIPNLGLAFAMLMVGKLSDMYGRRALLIACLVVSLVGALWCSFSTTFVMLIIARTLLNIGQGGLAPLCFSVLGDMFEPVQRSRWIGLLNIPAGIFSLFGPALGGWFVDNLSWRYIFWCGTPLLVAALLMVLFCLSRSTQQTAHKIDSHGSLLAAIASSTMILGFSMAGTMYPWASIQVIGSLAVSVVFWALFLQAEKSAEEPIVDLEVLRNRSFITLATAGLFSSFGMAGLMIYYPLFLQGVQRVTATQNGWLIMPGMVLMNFIGVPAGFILARTKRYKWMFILGYGIALAVIIALTFFTASTPVFWGFCAITLAGMGMGTIPTLNTLVAQYAVPKRLLGVVMGALYFSVMIGQALAPAILGSAMNMTYNSTLKATIPTELSQLTDQATITSLGNPKVLLSEEAMDSLRNTLVKTSANGEEIFNKTVSAIRASMEASLRSIYIIGAVAMLLTFIIICTIPEISVDTEVEDEKAIESPPPA
jgi:MFS family permease